MSSIILTGPVRSGKSAAAEGLAESRGRDVVVAVAGWAGDAEMARRIAAHRISRPARWTVIEPPRGTAWLAEVPPDAVLVLDCLGTLVSNECIASIGEAETASAAAEVEATASVDALVRALLTRSGDTIVVTNETGWGVVPAWAVGRVFRDLLGRANRALIDAADAAYLVIDGRFLDLRSLPASLTWPIDGSEENSD